MIWFKKSQDFYSAELYVKLSGFLIWILKNLKTHKHITQVKGKDYACAIYSTELYAKERNWFISVSTFDIRFDEKFVLLRWLSFSRSWFHAFSNSLFWNSSPHSGHLKWWFFDSQCNNSLIGKYVLAWECHDCTLQSLTGKVQVFYREFPV